MPRRYDEDDEDDDDLPDGVYHDDGLATVPCPYCREPVPDDASRCPNCENYISAEDAPPAQKSTWIVIGLLVCLLLAIMIAFL